MWLLDQNPSTVLDVGGGVGAFRNWMRDRTKCDVVSTDPIYGSGGLPNVRVQLLPDYVTCFDVLEHLPEDTIPAALANLERLTWHGCVCSISCASEVRDIDGEPVQLHLTRQGPDWWLQRFRAAFTNHEIHYRPLHYPERFWIIAERL
jgi:hypothetical protein